MGVAWEVQALVLQGQVAAHTAGKTQACLLTCALFADYALIHVRVLTHTLVVVFCSCLFLLHCSAVAAAAEVMEAAWVAPAAAAEGMEAVQVSTPPTNSKTITLPEL